MARTKGAGKPWEAFKLEWIQRSLAIRKAYDYTAYAKEIGVTIGTLRNKASKEGWGREFTSRLTQITAQAVSEVQNDSVMREVEVRSRNARMYAHLMVKAVKYISDMEEKDWTFDKAIAVIRACRGGELESYGLERTYDYTEKVTAEGSNVLQFERPLNRQQQYNKDRKLAADILRSLAGVANEAADREEGSGIIIDAEVVEDPGDVKS